MLAEKALLGSFIKENYLIADTAVKPEQFQDARNRCLFNTMKDLHSQGKSVDIITLTTLADPETFGGVSYLNEIESYANPKKYEEYEQLVIEAWKNREKTNILTVAREEDWDIRKVISSLDAINEQQIDDYTPITDALVKMYEAPWQEGQEKKGVTTGLTNLNKMTNGFQDGELTIIAARPSMGKTDVMLHFAKQAGWSGNLPIIFSLEMSKESITNRLIASTGRINRLKMNNLSALTDSQKNIWPAIIGKVGDTNIQIFDKAGQTIAEMRAKIRKLMHKFPDRKPIIFIDYLTLIRPEQFYGGNAHQQVTEISKNLKNMAKEFNIPVICLAQLSRAVESRNNKRPMMSDIRESGSVEQDADLIIFLYREKYYNKEINDDTLEIILSKQRNGPVGTVLARYNEFTGVIEDER